MPVLDSLLLFFKKKLPDFFYLKQLEKVIFFVDEKRWTLLPYGLWSQFSLPFFVSPKWCHVLFCLILHICMKPKYLELYSKQVNYFKKLLWLWPSSLLVSQLNMKRGGSKPNVFHPTTLHPLFVYTTPSWGQFRVKNTLLATELKWCAERKNPAHSLVISKQEFTCPNLKEEQWLFQIKL